ncbi:MAG: PQQ-binding-like beta-propeller repeat protein [Planctomycetota bacterium]
MSFPDAYPVGLLTRIGLLASVCFSWPSTVSNADWPGLLGPTRDGFAAASPELSDHSKSTPKLRWEIDAGQGYAGAAIQQDRVVMFFREGANDVIQAVMLDQGKSIWKTTFPATYRQGIDSDTGPRCVPLIASGKVLAYSAAGTLHCVDLADGKKLWSRELRKEYGAEDGYFGAGSTPLLVDNSVIVNVGGRKKGGVVAVSLADGKTQWQATDADASYASPILWNQQIVVPTRLETFGLKPTDGSVLWKIPFGQRGPTVNAATPIVTKENNLFLTSSYGIGFMIAKQDGQNVQTVQKGDAISSQYATPIAVDESIYGSDGREDGGFSSFQCIDSATGKSIWSESGIPICHVIGLRGQAGTNLLLVGINGKLWLLPASREGFKPTWTTQLPLSEGKYRALPALSKNLLVVRTSGGSNSKWRCFEL